MSWMIPAVTATLLGTFMLTLVYLYIYRQYRKRRELINSEQRYRLLTENALDMIYRYRLFPEHSFEYVSPACILLTGYTPEELYADPDITYKIVDPDYHGVLHKVLSEETDINEPIIIKCVNKDSRVFWSEHRCVLIYDEKGNVVALEGIARDVTERTLAQEAMQRYQLLCEHARDIILFFRQDGQVIEANDAAVQAYGYSRDELLTKNLCDLRPPETKNLVMEQILQAEESGTLYENVHQRADGSTFPVEVNAQGTVIENQRVLFAVVRDITERKRAEETINHLAYHDPLTDLPNRILFFDRLNVALAHAQRSGQTLAVMFLDLDRFKVINDMMGHAMGDLLLKQVTNQLKRTVRADDTVARIGGDEFTILLPIIRKEEDAATVAKKITETIKKPWFTNGCEFQITASIGIAIYPNDGEDAEVLTRNADTAMYRAKEQGDNYQFYTPAINLKAVERMDTERALRRAIEQNEFEIFYQPQVDIGMGRVVGLEALLRWRHPERGLVMPQEFIPVAEESGLIIPIGEWVLKTACTQVMEWEKVGLGPVRMAVNLSACQFRKSQLVDTVKKVLKQTGMDANFLELEITESTAMQDVEFTIATIRILREMGIKIAIDDFGTGYSSLNYLRRFPITTLKIDRSFVRDVLTDVEDAAIVATIIVLAQNLRLKVVVEGVETEDQLFFFEQQECFLMQGYLFSEPKPAAEVKKLLKKATLSQISLTGRRKKEIG